MKSYNMVRIAPDQWSIYKQLQCAMAHEDQTLYPGSYQREQAINDTAWQSRLADTRNPLLFARKQNKYVGMIGARSMGPLLARLVSLYVIPTERRKGIASLLVESILAIIKNQGVIKAQLLVHIQAEAAIRLYKRCDFKIVGKIQCYSDGNLYEQFLMEQFLSK